MNEFLLCYVDNIHTEEDALEEMLVLETFDTTGHVPHGELHVWSFYTALYCKIHITVSLSFYVDKYTYRRECNIGSVGF